MAGEPYAKWHLMDLPVNPSSVIATDISYLLGSGNLPRCARLFVTSQTSPLLLKQRGCQSRVLTVFGPTSDNLFS